MSTDSTAGGKKSTTSGKTLIGPSSIQNCANRPAASSERQGPRQALLLQEMALLLCKSSHHKCQPQLLSLPINCQLLTSYASVNSRQCGAAGADSSNSDCETWAELPQPLTTKVLSYLDATSLVMAACACREWHCLAEDDVLWIPLIIEDRLQSDSDGQLQRACHIYRSLMNSRLEQHQREHPAPAVRRLQSKRAKFFLQDFQPILTAFLILDAGERS